jgi:hypothetical protein
MVLVWTAALLNVRSKLVVDASMPVRISSLICARPTLASRLNSAPNRSVIARPTRNPSERPRSRFLPARVRTGSSGVIGVSWGKVRSTSLNSAAPSPKYQDDTARLGVNSAAAGA